MRSRYSIGHALTQLKRVFGARAKAEIRYGNRPDVEAELKRVKRSLLAAERQLKTARLLAVKRKVLA